MKLIIVTKDAVVVDEIDLKGYDLSKPMARNVLLDEIEEIVERGKRMEEKS